METAKMQVNQGAESVRGTIALRTGVRLAAGWILVPAVFLASSGSLRWWQAWAWCGIILVPMTVFALSMIVHDPGFLDRRFRMKEKDKVQKKIQILGMVPFLLTILVPGLDRRFGVSELPYWLAVAGLCLSLLGYLAILRVFLENRWAGRTVETWAEQRVISSGPYALVRHPMYSALIVFWLATPLALGSLWGLIPAATILPILVARIISEEAVLSNDLPGYDEYRRNVRYRLVPLFW